MSQARAVEGATSGVLVHGGFVDGSEGSSRHRSARARRRTRGGRAVTIHYQDRWAVVTGASSGLGRGLAARLADRGMSLVLTGRNEARLNDVAHEIRRAAPRVKVETVAADLSTASGVSALIDHVGDRPIEVLVNNAGFGSYGPFAEADPDREADEVAVDVSAVVTLARTFLPGMLARRSGGILNVASAIAFQPAPYQAVYGASKAFVLSFSEALWAEARAAGVAVTALCPGPTRTGFVDALGADVGHTAIYSRLAEPGPVIEAGLQGARQGPCGRHSRHADQGDRRQRPVHATRVAHPALRPAAASGRHGLATADRGPQRDRDSGLGGTRVGSVDRRRSAGRHGIGPAGGSGSSRPVVQPRRQRAGPCRSGGRRTRSCCAAPWWPAIARARSRSSRTAEACTPSARSRSARRRTAGVPSSSAMRRRSACCRGWAGLFLAPRLHAANQAMFDDLARAATKAAATTATARSA